MQFNEFEDESDDIDITTQSNDKKNENYENKKHIAKRRKKDVESSFTFSNNTAIESLPPLPKFRKNDMNRLVSNMVVTSISKPNLEFFVTFGTKSQEGISSMQWWDMFSLAFKGVKAGRMQFQSFSKFWEHEYHNHIMCKYYTNGKDSECYKQKVKSRLLFTNDDFASLQYTLREKRYTYEDSNSEKKKLLKFARNPESDIKNVSWVMTWIFKKESDNLRYEFIQTVVGKTYETACAQDIQHLIRIFPENVTLDVLNMNHSSESVVPYEKKHISEISSLNLTYNATVFTQNLIGKVLKLYGHGPNPKLIHCPLRHKSKKPETSNNKEKKFLKK